MRVVRQSVDQNQGIFLPDNLFTEGISNSDYYLLISSRPIDSQYTLAYAAPCSHEILQFNPLLLSRPLAGSINFNPGTDQLNDPDLLLNPFEYAKLIRISLHELTHALGFASELYPYFVDSNGMPYNNFTKPYRYNSVIPTHKVISPKVVDYVRHFFDCHTMDGMELESSDDMVGEGLGSHWEKRLVGNEYMSPVSGPELFVSRLTLALFEDMGWYRADYTKAEGNRWGYHEGCDFVNLACGSANWGRYFCSAFETEDSPFHCNGDQTSFGICDLTEHTQPLGGYAYFTDPYYGGSELATDFCPIYLGYSNTYCQDVVLGHQWSGTYGMNFSSTSACFDFRWGEDSTIDAACYQLSCDNGLLSIKILGDVVSCPQAGGEVAINIPYQLGESLHSAFITCPPADFFCGKNTSLLVLGPTLVEFSHSIIGIEFQMIILMISLMSLFLYHLVNE